MTTKYGYEYYEWVAAKREMRDVLIERARHGGTISCSELIPMVTTISFEPEAYAFAAMLGEISSEEAAAGRGMLSVVVVQKSGEMQPGRGFFDLAKRLGRDTSDTAKCWIEELKHVHHVWSTSEAFASLT